MWWGFVANDVLEIDVNERASRRIHTVSATSDDLEVAMRVVIRSRGRSSVSCSIESAVCGGERASVELGVSRSTGWVWWREAGGWSYSRELVITV